MLNGVASLRPRPSAPTRDRQVERQGAGRVQHFGRPFVGVAGERNAFVFEPLRSESSRDRISVRTKRPRSISARMAGDCSVGVQASEADGIQFAQDAAVSNDDTATRISKGTLHSPLIREAFFS